LGKPDRKLTAKSRGAFDFDPASMGSDQIPCDAQAEPHPLRETLSVGAPVEGCKDSFPFFWSNSRSRIADSHPYPRIFAASRYGYLPARRSILDRVAHQVANRLRKSVRISAYGGGAGGAGFA